MDGRWADPRLTSRERAALKYADQMWHDHNAVSPEVWGELMSAFMPAEFIELGMTVGQYIAMGQLMAMLGVPAAPFREEADQ